MDTSTRPTTTAPTTTPVLPDEERLTVVVVGASRGIGAAVASTFAAQGHRVVGTHRGSGTPDGVEPFELDVTDSARIAELFAHVGRTGKADVVVVAAGVTRDAPLVRMSDEDIDTVLETNLVGPMRVVRAAASKIARGGSIVLLSSVSARLGHVGQANYTAAKAGLEGFVRTVAQEYAARFRINIVAPGPTRTDMFTDASDEARRLMEQGTPMRRVAEPQEIADVVSWVSRSTFMTGATVPVAGGLLI